MPDTHRPRSGSMQFWPRKRANRIYARIRGWAKSEEAKPLAFMGYKVGMTHVMAIDNNKNTLTKGESLPFPVTIIECPPMRIMSVRSYEGSKVAKEIFVGDYKFLKRKVSHSKPKKIDFNSFSNIKILMHTQPDKTNSGKKKPEVFEVALGGSDADRIEFIKKNIGKDINISDVFAEGDLVDIHAVTKGYGTQGPVKRFGIGLKHHKSEKGRRRPGSLGGWSGQQHFMYRIAMSGQTGYHQRVQYNSQIMKISEDPKKINAEGGFKKYGVVKGNYILLRGSVQGPPKRPITIIKAIRTHKKVDLPTIQYISTSSQRKR